MISDQIPILFDFSEVTRLKFNFVIRELKISVISLLFSFNYFVSQTNFLASSRISAQLLSKANRGAKGNVATKLVINPNCSTLKLYYSFKPHIF